MLQSPSSGRSDPGPRNGRACPRGGGVAGRPSPIRRPTPIPRGRTNTGPACCGRSETSRTWSVSHGEFRDSACGTTRHDSPELDTLRGWNYRLPRDAVGGERQMCPESSPRPRMSIADGHCVGPGAGGLDLTCQCVAAGVAERSQPTPRPATQRQSQVQASSPRPDAVAVINRQARSRAALRAHLPLTTDCITPQAVAPPQERVEFGRVVSGSSRMRHHETLRASPIRCDWSPTVHSKPFRCWCGRAGSA